MNNTAVADHPPAYELFPPEEMLSSAPVPLRCELLEDTLGPFGVRVTRTVSDEEDLLLALRPDRLRVTNVASPCLQKVSYAPIFKYVGEKTLIYALLAERNGLPRFPGEKWTKEDRQRYFGLKRSCHAIVNSYVDRILHSVPADLLTAARQFPFRYRWDAYRWGSASSRQLQAMHTFPCLLPDFDDFNPEVFGMIENGAPLRRVAKVADVPFVFRKIKAGALLAFNNCRSSLLENLNGYGRNANRMSKEEKTAFNYERLAPLVSAYLPEKTVAQRRWLRAISISTQERDPLYINWVAKNALQLGTTMAGISNQVSDIADFVEDSRIEEALRFLPDRLHPLINNRRVRTNDPVRIARPFNPEMAAHTVIAQAARWAADVSLRTAPNHELPPAWCSPGQSGGLEFVPLATAADIAEEGFRMHHCVRTRIPDVAADRSNIISVRKGGERVATVEVRRGENGRVFLSEYRGRMNATVPRATVNKINRWISKTEWTVPARKEVEFIDDDEIPF